MNMDSRQIIKELKKAGFVLVKVSGDRHKFKHENGKIVIVPHPQKDLPIGTA
ncbi:MAG: type II toxin-antitoxin system HicA family toxin, partial [Desulfobacula sp.]|nr:type II toxin-antitoxin system HicA family toxin [Desulfobacula sp.]MBT7795140.1 type II toxin-antitoxin system HicA family toxin [Desulfobacula sp.]